MLHNTVLTPEGDTATFLETLNYPLQAKFHDVQGMFRKKWAELGKKKKQKYEDRASEEEKQYIVSWAGAPKSRDCHSVAQEPQMADGVLAVLVTVSCSASP